MKRSPLFRIAILSLAVLFAHTAHTANVRHTFPAAPPCPRKVAAAQPDPESKPALKINRQAKPRLRAGFHSLSGGFLPFAAAHLTAVLFTTSASRTAFPQHAASIAPQHWPFVLRL